MGPLLGRSHGKALNERKVASTLELNCSVSARISNSSSPRRSMLQVQVGCSQLSPLQDQAQLGGATKLSRIDQKNLLLWVALAEPSPRQ